MAVEAEIIMAREALARVGLGHLAPEGPHSWGEYRVHWTGYPPPLFGHHATYGYGPLDDPDKPDPDRRGVGRRYQAVHQVSQHTCSGPVLFAWNLDARRGGLVVSIVELADRKGWTALRAGITG